MGTKDLRFASPKAPREQLVLFPQYLDQLVATDAPVRSFAALLDEIEWSSWENKYVGCGQPPIHPRYLAGAILFGLLHKVLSTRELEEASRKHLDFIWLLEGFQPDHSTFAKFRKRHAQDINGLHKQIAQTLVMKRQNALLRLIIDGTRLRANSERQGARKAKTIEAIIGELDRRMAQMELNDAQAAPATDYFQDMEPQEADQETLAQVDKEIVQLKKKRAKYQKALDVAHERDERSRKHNGKNAKPVRVPVTDPESHICPNKEGGYAPNYTPVATVEAQTGAIVHSDVLPASDEASAVIPAVQAAQALTGQKTDAVLADTNFASGEVLDALDSNDIEAYMPTRSVSPPDNPAPRPDPTIPVAEQDRKRLPKQGKYFARTAFVYDAMADLYHCPMGHALTLYERNKSKRGRNCNYYRCQACSDCPVAPDCVKRKDPYRSITRDEYEPLREATNQRMATPEGKAIYKTRSPAIEGVFGIIKSCLGIRRFSLRGLDNVRMEWTWICAAYNLKKLLALTDKAGCGDTKTANRQDISTTRTNYASIMRLSGNLILQTIRYWLRGVLKPKKNYKQMKYARA